MAAATTARRAATLTAFWRVLRASRRPGDPGLAERLGAAPRLFGATLRGRYPGLNRAKLALFGAALAYIVSPVDLVPEALLAVLGLADDVAVAAWLASAVLVETDRFIWWERGRPAPADDPSVIRGDVVG